MYIAQHLQRMSSLICGMILAGSILSTMDGEAATYYVAIDGTDTNPGTAAQPFRTIEQGISELQAGDTLYIKSGTYDESIDSFTITIPSGTSWSSPVTVSAYPGETVTLKPNNSRNVIDLGDSSIQYLVFQNLVLDASNVINTLSAQGNAVYISYGAHHIRFIGGEFTNAPANGAQVAGSFNEFIGVKVHDNGTTAHGHGMYITGSNNVVEESQVYHNAGWGVHIYTGTRERADYNIARNNEVFENGWGSNRGFGIILSSGTGNVASDNRIWGNKGGLQVDYGSINTEVSNNEIYENEYWGILIGHDSQGAMVLNNNIYENYGPAIVDLGSGTMITP